MIRTITICLAIFVLAGCSEPPGQPEAAAPTAASATPFAETFRLALETAQPGDVITVPEGRFEFDRSVTLATDGVTIKGAGMDRSVLSFQGQVAGAEGLLVNASDFTIEDLAIEDTVGDALKINEGSNIVVRRVRTEWTNGPSTENGAYGIYPVQTENTLIEGSVAIGASDAGIYVGQSRNVVVRDNRAEYNVAGIEIENTIGADVYDNLATNNTGGILVFNMPDLPQAGHSTRVFDNRIVANNTPNFGVPGSAVAGVPAGSGMVINSNDRVEIFRNTIAENQTANILISSYFSANYAGARELAEAFDPFPESIYIYENEFSGGGNAPDREALEAVRILMFGETGALPDIVWDGVVNPERTGPEYAICVQNGDAQVLNVDGQNEYKNPTVDADTHDCALEKLGSVALAQS
jgi:parallel beta-helix repeat protein